MHTYCRQSFLLASIKVKRQTLPAIPINLKSLYSDFPAKSLQFPLNICSVGSELLGKEIKERFEHWMPKDKNF